MRFIPVGVDALLVEVGDVGEATALFAEARHREVDAVDVVPGARTVLFDGVRDLARLVEGIRSWSPSPSRVEGSSRVDVPTSYDGADLAEVARMWDMTTREVVATHTSCEMVVAFCGFSPGFAYCTGLPGKLAVSRLDSPRSKVPAGSVGLAGEFTGVYPQASPGGWRLIGHTELTMWDEAREEPATLPPGTAVRFVEVGS